MKKINLLGYTSQRLEDLATTLGDKSYRGRQLFKWLYKVRQYDFSLMTDLSRPLREKLTDQYTFEGLTLTEEQVSNDGTRKFLFRLDDGQPLEAVLISDDEDRNTVCISSQVGCALGCRFCATGTMGFKRDLTVGEIVGQLIYIRDHYGDEAFGNVVFMGMGEPLLNYDRLLDAVDIMSASDGLSISAKKVTVSTSGISPKIIRLADSGVKVRLAVSLHAATEEKRLQIMPMVRSFRLDKLMDAVRYYALKTKTRVTFEYILFKGFNDSIEDIQALAKLIRGIPCKINLLAYNPVEGLEYKRPTDDEVDWFARHLYPRAPAVTVRKSRGRDIDAACGQLAARRKIRRGSNV